MGTANELNKLRRGLAQLREVVALITPEGLQEMSLNFDRLKTEVAEMGTVVESAVSVLRTVAADLRNSASDQAQIEALADELDKRAADLSMAIAGNTAADAEPVSNPDDVPPVTEAIE